MTITAPQQIPATSDLAAMGNRVVVGMDDDAVSITALRFAATEAAYRGADVLAVHVWHYPNTWGYPVLWTDETNPGTYILEQLQKTVDTVQAERAEAKQSTVSIRAEVVQGAYSEQLIAVADGAALLVLGARHHNRLLGSVSQACMNHPPCALVVVPPLHQPR
ncbi:MAG: universal stress protein [Jatrophihabitans sp.]